MANITTCSRCGYCIAYEASKEQADEPGRSCQACLALATPDQKVEVGGTITMGFVVRVLPGTSRDEIIECIMEAGPQSITSTNPALRGVWWWYDKNDVRLDGAYRP